VVLALALVLSLVNPWALLQSGAWVSMAIEFSRHNSLTRALVMTFDGQHPCKLCHAIDAGKAQDRQKPKQTAPAAADLKLFLPPTDFRLVHPPMPGVSPDAPFLPGARNEAPPIPPPRFA